MVRLGGSRSEGRSLQFFGVIREAQERYAARVGVKRDLRLRMPPEIIGDYLADAANDEVNYEAIAAESID